MVCIQQLFVPAVFLLGLSQQVAAAPLASRAGIAVRDLTERDIEDFDLVLRSLYGDEVDLETRAGLFNALKAVPSAFKAIKHVMPGSKTLKTAVSGAIKTKNAVKGAAKAVGKAVKNNKGKTFDRVLATSNTAMNAANTAKAQQKGKRDLEDLELILRSLSDDEMDLETRANLLGALKKIPSLAKGAAKLVGSTIKKNKGKTFDRVLKTADTSMNIAKTAQTQKGKRDVEGLGSDLESRSNKKAKKGRRTSKKSKKMAASRKQRHSKKLETEESDN